MARRCSPILNGDQWRSCVQTDIDCIFAARIESAPCWQLRDHRDGAPDLFQVGAAYHRDAGEEVLCVWVDGTPQYLFHSPDLEDRASVHYHHPIAGIRDDPDIMADHEDRQA